MKKIKFLTIFFIVLELLLILPNVSNAATTEYTYSDTEQGIEWSYQLDDSNNVIQLKCKTTSKIGAVTIPSTIEGKTVISLKGKYSDGAFQDCTGITSVTIPNTITLIGECAFNNCTGLKSITLPDSVTKIEESAFNGCSGMTTVTLSNNLTSIGMRAFEGCSGLKSFTIPDSVTTIEYAAFVNCSGLKSLTLSKKLTKISDRTFEGCSGLTSVILPESVTTIEGNHKNIYGAFGDCTNLAKILIPDSVASIGIGAFQGCKKLTIYGNDEQTSKSFAEANGINFKYISEWNKSDVGDDITPPYVESIQVAYSSVSGYYDSNSTTYIVPSGKVLIINVNFNENILATKVPSLTIRFGSSSNIVLTEGTVSGSTVAYTYTIASGDVGTMATVSLTGGDIKDAAGNEATLSCPELKVQYGFDHYIYANGTAVDVEEGNNNNNNDQAKEEGNNNNNNNNNNDPVKEEDNTTASGKLPQTGLTMGISLAIVVLLVSCIFAYKKHNKLKGI